MKKTKRIFAIVLAVLMTVAVVPVAAFAEDSVVLRKICYPSGDYETGELVVELLEKLGDRKLEEVLPEIEIASYYDIVQTVVDNDAVKGRTPNPIVLERCGKLFRIYLAENTKEAVIAALDALTDNENILYAEANSIFPAASVGEGISIKDFVFKGFPFIDIVNPGMDNGEGYDAPVVRYEVPEEYTITEALEALRVAAGIVPATTSDVVDKYDMNGDRYVTVSDALAILRKVAGLDVNRIGVYDADGIFGAYWND